MRLRQALFGAGLTGLLSSSALAQDTGYMDLSASEVQAEVLKRAQRFRYDDFKRLEGNENFDGVVLASSTCPIKEKAILNTRNEIIFLQLMDKYQDTNSFNGDPLVFGYFDVCGRSGADLLGLDLLAFVMYLDGKEIDRRIGGPLDPTTIDGNTKAMSAWIDSNLLEKPYVRKGENKKILFYGKYEPTFEPFFQP